MRKNEEGVLQQINRVTEGDFDSFLLQHNICSLCLVENGQVSFLKKRDGEKVCVECGYTPRIIGFEKTIPIGVTMNPENQISDSRGLGNTLGRKGQFCVLAQSSLTKQMRSESEKQGEEPKDDLPIRSRHITVITKKFDHPKIMSMLRFGRQLAHQWGFDQHKQKQSIVFSNTLGGILRTVGAWLIARGTRASLKKISEASFAYALKKVKGEEAYRRAMEQLNVDPILVTDVATMCTVLEEL